MCMAESKTIVPPITESFSLAKVGFGSPVIIDVSTDAEPLTMKPSKGTVWPTLTSSSVPSTICSTGTSKVEPSVFTTNPVLGFISINEKTASVALSLAFASNQLPNKINEIIKAAPSK